MGEYFAAAHLHPVLDFMPSRPLNTVNYFPRRNVVQELRQNRNEGRRRNEPEEGWRDASGQTSIRNRQRCRERD